MNKIIDHQNDQTILDKLSAQRKLYDKAKKLRGLRFFLGLCLWCVYPSPGLFGLVVNGLRPH